ncbi:MAG: 2-dehydro-3-deoxy-D-gluconate 5-dehydrogenase KduD [Anaerolineae bacterium]
MTMGILDLFNLSGKVALVTGANRGLGQAVAVGLAEAGADIAGLNRSEEDGGTGDLVRALGRQYTHNSLDLSTATVSDLAAAVDNVVSALGRLDILVNNAGIIRRTPALEYTEADWDDVMNVNLKVVFFLSQAAARYMKEQGGGKIIHIASMLSYQGGINVPSYTAAKHGIMGITRAMANEWAPHNINVNAIAPGYMVTDNTAALRADDKRYSAILERIPAGRWGESDDMKGATVFLASDAAAYLHGATIPVDGAWLAR